MKMTEMAATSTKSRLFIVLAVLVLSLFLVLNTAHRPVFSVTNCTSINYYLPQCHYVLSQQLSKAENNSELPLDCFHRNSDRLVTIGHLDWCSDVRLGNRMFMIASAIGIACRNNATFILPPDKPGCRKLKSMQLIFQGLTDNIKVADYTSVDKWSSIDERNHMYYSNYILPLHKNYTVSGYRQNWRYFQNYSRSIKKLYSFSDSYYIIAMKVRARMREKYSIIPSPVFVGVHARRGDLNRQDRVKYGYVMANVTFYEKALRIISDRYGRKNVIFVVTSDDMAQAREMLKSIAKTYFIEYVVGDSGMDDLATLSHMDHMIISGGTYGFWAAWLCDGDVVYFSQFARPGSKLVQDGYCVECIHLPSWTPETNDL